MAGKRSETSRISSSAGTGPIRSWTSTTSGRSSSDSPARRARVSMSWVESVTGAAGSASGSWLSRVVTDLAASTSPTAGRILVVIRSSLVLVERVGAVARTDGAVAAGGQEGEAYVLREGLGVGDALGVERVEREGDRDGLGAHVRLAVAVGLQGGQLADVQDLGVGDDDLRLGGVAVALTG